MDQSGTIKFLFRYYFLGLVIMLLNLPSAMGQVTADFSSSGTEACGSLKVNFYDQSTVNAGNSILSWEWELGDVFSSKQNPGVIFTEAGSFTVCLKVTDNNGNTDRVCKENYVKVYADPVADFSVDNFSGCSPLTIAVNDLSSSDNGKITKWVWDLGGTSNVINTSTPLDNITTTYDVAGTYSLSLTVEDEKRCSTTIQKKDVVDVKDFIAPDIDFTLLRSCNYPWEVQFNNLSPDPEIQYFWDFGNGNTYSGPAPPVIEYSLPGKYDVTVISQNGACVDTTVFQDYIITEKEENFSISTETICVGTPVEFKDVASIYADSILWVFGDGEFARAGTVSHTFDREGCFPVELIRYRSDCIDTISGNCVRVFPVPDITYNIENQFTCGVPAEITLNGISSGTGTFDWRLTGNGVDQTLKGEIAKADITAFGSYKVDLVFTDITGCVASIEDIDLDIISYSVSLPSVGPSGCIPLNATMTDSVRSAVPISTWDWTIYDHDTILYTSTVAAPSFLISEAGKYDVQLIVENIYGCRDTVYRDNYIQAGTKPAVDFEASPLNSCINETKSFIDLSDNTVNRWYWEFGDSTNSREQNPIKLYSQPGKYDVTLTVFYNGCSANVSKTEYITIHEPASAFEIVYNCQDPHTVELNNLSSGADTQLWSIFMSPGDTLTFSDSLILPVTFPGRGKYPVTLYTFNDSSGCENMSMDTVVITNPEAQFTLDTLAGCAPLEIITTDKSIDAQSFQWTAPGAIINMETSPNPAFRYTTPGSYPGPGLIVKDIHGCMDSFFFPGNLMINQVNAAAIFDDIICVPGDFIPTDASTDVFGNIISYQWKINDTLLSDKENPVFNIDQPMIYDLELTVSDDWNCTDTEVYKSAFEGVELVPDFTVDTLSCTWAPVRFRPQNSPVNVDSFLWDFGDGNFSTEKNPNYAYSSEGTYTVCLKMIDKRGCEQQLCKEDYVNIRDPRADFAGDVTNSSCPPLLTKFSNTSLNSNSLFWSFGDNSGNSTVSDPSHVYTEPGSFDVQLIVTMTSACRDTLLIEDYITLEGPAGSFSQQVDSTCIPLAVTLYTQTDADYTYIYDYGNGVLDSLTSKASSDTRLYNYSETGRYIPKVIIIDDKGCTRALAGDPVFVNAVELQYELSDTSFCSLPAMLSIANFSNSSSGNITYSWSIDGPNTYSSSDEQPSFNIDTPGVYSVMLRAKTENCVDTLAIRDAVEISGIPNTDFSFTVDQQCDNIEVAFKNLTSPDGGVVDLYSWDFGDGASSTDSDPVHIYDEIKSFTVSLTATTNNGCTSSMLRNIPVTPGIVLDAGLNDTICTGEDYRLSASIENLTQGAAYFWQDDLSLSCTDCLDPGISPAETTLYTLFAIDPDGCISEDSVLITVISLPGPMPTLLGDTIVCPGSEARFTVENIDPDLTYLWSSDQDFLDCDSGCTTVTAAVDSPTNFYVTLVSKYGCLSTDTITVNVITENNNIITEDHSICSGDSITLVVENGEAGSWEDAQGISCTLCPEPVASPPVSTVYYVDVVSDGGCHYRDSISIRVIPPESTYAGEDTLLCIGESIVISGRGTGSPSWFENDTSSSILSSIFDLPVSPRDTAIYILRTIEDKCILFDTVMVNVIEKASISAVGDTVCFGDKAILSASPNITDRFWWEFPDGTRLVNEQSIEVSPDSTLTYRLIGAYSICLDDTATVQVVVNEEIDADIAPAYQIYANESLTLKVDYDLDKNYTFEWFPNDGLSCSTCSDPDVVNLSGNTNYSLVIRDEDTGCEIEKQVSIRFINECSSSVFYIPNIFSPNEDGRNDLFRVYSKNETDFRRIHIFDRWGNKVFFSEDINRGWDGDYTGGRLSSGVYTYRVDAYCPLTGEEFYFVGDVTLLR